MRTAEASRAHSVPDAALGSTRESKDDLWTHADMSDATLAFSRVINAQSV